MEYDVPIVSADHADYCRAEAERRYSGTVIRDLGSGMLLVEDSDGVCHTDPVLRALSFYPPGWMLGTASVVERLASISD